MDAKQTASLTGRAPALAAMRKIIITANALLRDNRP
jgi:hypothetical protein